MQRIGYPGIDPSGTAWSASGGATLERTTQLPSLWDPTPFPFQPAVAATGVSHHRYPTYGPPDPTWSFGGYGAPQPGYQFPPRPVMDGIQPLHGNDHTGETVPMVNTEPRGLGLMIETPDYDAWTAMSSGGGMQMDPDRTRSVR